MVLHIRISNAITVTHEPPAVLLILLYGKVKGYADDGSAIFLIRKVGISHLGLMCLVHLAQLVCVKAFVDDTAEPVGIEFSVLQRGERVGAKDVFSLDCHNTHIAIHFFLFCRHGYPSFRCFYLVFYFTIFCGFFQVGECERHDISFRKFAFLPSYHLSNITR